MRDTLKALTAAAVLCMGMTPALAQDTAAKDTPVVVNDPTISSGTTEGENPVGSRYVAQTHGDWELVCTRMPEGQKDRCGMFQMLVDQGANPTAEFNIGLLATEQGVAVIGEIVTPLETLLTKGMRLSVDDGQAKIYPFQTCSKVGCLLRMTFSCEVIEAFKRGANAQVVIVPFKAPDREVRLSVSLTGFTAALDAMVESATAE
ncbi:invasion associated locus B family protein, partial [Escherichia coli]|nr:invasion associated locus B family protein [Escherichia coli]